SRSTAVHSRSCRDTGGAGESWPGRDVVMFAYTATATRLRPLGERLGLLAPPGEPTSGQPAGPYDCRDTRHRDARIFNGFGKVDSLAYLAQIRERTGIAISPTPCCPGTLSTRSTRTHADSGRSRVRWRRSSSPCCGGGSPRSWRPPH